MKKSKKRRAKTGGLALAAVLCALLMSACGTEQAMAETESTALPAAEKESAASETAGKESAAPVTTEGESTQPEEESLQSQEAASGASEPESAPAENTAAGREEAAVQEEQAETLKAVIESVGANAFTVREIYTETLEDGVMIAVDNYMDENRKIIEVTYTDQTAFTIRTTRNGGMEHSDSVGSAADLKEEVSAILTGTWDGDIFRASEVLLYNHQ